jgi:hypothetical protein
MPFTRLERYKSLIERWRVVSCCVAQVNHIGDCPFCTRGYRPAMPISFRPELPALLDTQVERTRIWSIRGGSARHRDIRRLLTPNRGGNASVPPLDAIGCVGPRARGAR